jgi:hypothetical protein
MLPTADPASRMRRRNAAGTPGTSAGLKSPVTVDFFFDPVCPFAWMTSRWVEQVAAARQLEVQWRFIALRMVNADKDYATDFPEGYERFHGAGLRMLRVAAAVRDAHGNEAVGRLYTAYGASIWDLEPQPDQRLPESVGTVEQISGALAAAGLPAELADAADDTTHDAIIDKETQMALARAGRDVGTPIITIDAPDGPSFFGPVISRLASDDDAVELWDAMVTLARFPGFSELKRSLREMPALRLLGG